MSNHSTYHNLASSSFANFNGELNYEYAFITKDQFYKKYAEIDWGARKISSLFQVFSSLVIKTIYHLFQAFLAEARKERTAQAFIFKAKRDLIEAKGWFLTLFRDRLGQFYVQQSAYHKKCYTVFINGNEQKKLQEIEIQKTESEKDSEISPSSRINEEKVSNSDSITSLKNTEKSKEKELNEEKEKIQEKFEGRQELKSKPLENLNRSGDSVSPIYGIVEYEKNKQKTNAIISCHKKALGSGVVGSVYRVKDRENLVVKKSHDSFLENGYKIGKKFNHKNLVNVHALIIKKDDTKQNSKKKKFKVLMDYVSGYTLLNLVGKREKLTANDLKLIIPQVKECCLYLHEIDVIWEDTNSGNIMINNDNRLTIIDYDFWIKKKNLETSTNKTTRLLINSAVIIGNLLTSSNISGFEMKRDTTKEVTQRINEIIYSNEAFKVFGAVNIFFGKSFDSQENKIAEFFENKTEEHCKKFLECYFDQILKNIENL